MHGIRSKDTRREPNLAIFVRFGCLKDLPEILYRVLHGDRNGEDGDHRKQQNVHCYGMKRRRSDREFEAAKERKRQERKRSALSRYESDDAFCFLYDGVAKVFAEMLKSDVEHLRVGDTTKIGLAAKWCPSLRSSYDRAMNKYKEVFQKHDKHRAAGFFDEVRTGRARMPADALLPHELIVAALKGEHDEAAELQWRRMAASLT
jgi:hypothetical protein